MNLGVDFSVVSRFLRGLSSELRQKRLWPVALALVAAVIAVPVLLSKSASPTNSASAPLPVSPPPSGTSIPTLNVQSTPTTSNIVGREHDPFAGSGSTTSPTATSAATAAASAAAAAGRSVSTALGGLGGNTSGSTTSGGSSTAGAGSSSTGSSGSSSTSGGNPPSITHSSPKPVPAGLTASQAYEVSLAMTNSSGDLNSIDSLKRLSVLPSGNQPLLVELGVAQGGNRVLFALEPGTVVRGPGRCIPGPIDCEILSLAQDQTESVGVRVGRLGASEVALFAVTGISAKTFSSHAAADRARSSASAAGRALLRKSSLPALSLFPFDAATGTVVDLRNLTVGSN